MNNNELDKLKADNARLTEEQKMAYDNLIKLNQKLEEADKFKSHFLSNISNEIVNPFTSILGISQNILLMGKDDIAQIHAMANLINSEAFDLDFQLRNIFAAAKIESGENNLELVNLKIKPFIEEIINSLQLKAEKRALYCDITYSFKKEYFVTDIDKLRMILINLVMNAIIFSTEQNAIKIYAELTDEGFLFRINNQGILISSEDTKIIFDRFIKLDENINSLNQGHGLGLSIIKDYLDLLGGSVNFESNKKEGTTFTIKLPYIENGDRELFIDDEDLFLTDDAELF